jgi:hypothetical protein
MSPDLESIFIRACKSRNPEVRLKSVYRRFYCKEKPSEILLAYLLSEIVDKYKLISVQRLISEFDEKFARVDAKQAFLWTIVNSIRYSETKKFTDLRIPRRFKQS